MKAESGGFSRRACPPFERENSPQRREERKGKQTRFLNIGKRLTQLPAYPGDPDYPPFAVPDPPWFYISRESTPLPFIVSYDFGWQGGYLLGEGGREYAFWFFGYKFPLYYRLQWFS